MQIDLFISFETGKIIIHERTRYLSRPVTSEIKKYHRVTVFDQCFWLLTITDYTNRLDKFIRHICIITFLHCFISRIRSPAFTAGHTVIRSFDPVPSLVAVHRVEPSHNTRYFTDAYLHRIDEIEAEIVEAGLAYEQTLAVEGPGWLLPDFEAWWEDDDRRKRLLDLLRNVEQERSMLGVSGHLLSIARK